MPESIRDGAGSGKLVHVDEENKLSTRATVIEQRLHAVSDAEYFETTTGKITLSNDTETPFVYIRNTHQEQVIVVDRVFFDSFDSDGTGSATIKYFKNPDITGGATMSHTNTNDGSSRSMVATLTQILTTMNGVEPWWTGQLSTNFGLALEEGRIIIPPGNAHGISITAPTGNTSYQIAVNFACYQVSIGEIE